MESSKNIHHIAMKILKLVLLTFALFPNFIKAQTKIENNTIKVMGIAELEIIPDEIHLIVNIGEVKGKNQTMSMEDARTAFYKICNDMKIANSDIDLKTLKASLVAIKVQTFKRKIDELYQGESYDIKFNDMDKMLAFIEKLDQPFVNSLYLGEKKHTKITEFKKQNKIDAVNAAMEKAKYMSKAAGREILKLIYLEEILDNSNIASQNIANTYSNIISSYDKGKVQQSNPESIFLKSTVLLICELK